MIPDDYICPICGNPFWSYMKYEDNPEKCCMHNEWDIIQHLTKLLEIERDVESDMPPSPAG